MEPKSTILFTKRLAEIQKKQYSFFVDDFDFISIESVDFESPLSPFETLIFTSQNAVKQVLGKTQIPITQPIYAVGKKTKECLLKFGNFQNIQIPEEENAEGLIKLIELHNSNDFLYFCGKKRLPRLENYLKEGQKTYRTIEVYNTCLSPILELDIRKYEYLCFCSPSAIESYLSVYKILPQHKILCIGKTTAKALNFCKNKIEIAPYASIESMLVVLNNKIKMSEYVNTLTLEFHKNSNQNIALHQKAYMKNKFEFYGIMAKKRREIQAPFLRKAYLPPKKEVTKLVKELWDKPQRECQYFAQELVLKYSKEPEKEDIRLLEFMVTEKSWWDTVDFISTKLMGEYFKSYSDEIDICVKKWLKSENIWLQRSALLFQLKYKEDVNTELLSEIINSLLGSKEFFINKAIGWMLREYGKTKPNWAIDFVNKTDLHNLSKREALKLIKTK